MSCSRFQFELSQCLDGRLPSARRAAVMTHVDACPACLQVWEEMQAAQVAVFGLDEHPVGPGFRDEVWNRIRAGEGSSEILLQEPITLATKMRYGVIGAAAAAAVILLGFSLLNRGASPDPADESSPTESTPFVADYSPGRPESRDNSGQAIAQDQRQPNTSGRLRRGHTNTGIPAQLTAAQLTPAYLAKQTVDKVTSSARRLRMRSELILERPPQPSAPFWQEVRFDLNMIDKGLFLLDRLQHSNFVTLEGRSRDCMIQARTNLRHPAGTRQEIQSLVKNLGMCSLAGLADHVGVTVRTQWLEPEQFIRVFFSDSRIRHTVEELKLGPGIMVFVKSASGVGVPGARAKIMVRQSARKARQKNDK